MRQGLGNQRVNRDGGRTEVPGQESQLSAMQDQQNAKTYNQYKQQRQKEIEPAKPSN